MQCLYIFNSNVIIKIFCFTFNGYIIVCLYFVLIMLCILRITESFEISNDTKRDKRGPSSLSFGQFQRRFRRFSL